MDVIRRMRITTASQLRFIDAVAFNYLIGNADAHAKNMSVVYRGKTASLAPLYDLVSTAVYPELSRKMAMSIGGDADFKSISRASFSDMARSCAVSPRLVLSRLDALCARIVPVAERVAAECAAAWPSEIYGRIVDTIANHATRLHRGCGS